MKLQNERRKSYLQTHPMFLYYTFAFCVCLWVRLSTISNSMIFCLCVCQLQRPMLFYLQSLPQWFSICLSVTTGKRRDRKPFKEDCWQSFVTDRRMDEKSFRGRLLIDRPTYRPYLVSKLGHSSNVSIFKSKFHPMQSKSKNLTENLQANASYNPNVACKCCYNLHKRRNKYTAGV